MLGDRPFFYKRHEKVKKLSNKDFLGSKKGQNEVRSKSVQWTKGTLALVAEKGDDEEGKAEKGDTQEGRT